MCSKSKHYYYFFSIVSICCFHLLTQCPHCQRAIFLCLLSLSMHKTFLTSDTMEVESNSDVEPEMQGDNISETVGNAVPEKPEIWT